MRKTVKGMWTFLAAAAFTAGLSMASLASTGWVKEGDDWYYLGSDARCSRTRMPGRKASTTAIRTMADGW